MLSERELRNRRYFGAAVWVATAGAYAVTRTDYVAAPLYALAFNVGSAYVITGSYDV